jgi:hypothetical protein
MASKSACAKLPMEAVGQLGGWGVGTAVGGTAVGGTAVGAGGTAVGAGGTAVGAGGTAVGAGDTALGSPSAGVGVRSESGVSIGVGEAALVAVGIVVAVGSSAIALLPSGRLTDVGSSAALGAGVPPQSTARRNVAEKTIRLRPLMTSAARSSATRGLPVSQRRNPKRRCGMSSMFAPISCKQRMSV